VKTIILALLDM